jgi:hypothetical protein
MPRSTSLTPGDGGNNWGDGADLGRDINTTEGVTDQRELVRINYEKIQQLSIGTLDPSRPFDKPFTGREAEHILDLLRSPSKGEQVTLRHFSREGFDGETFHYAGIRRKDNSIPRDPSIKRIYIVGLVHLGFVDHDPEGYEFVEALRDADIEVDEVLLHLVR